MSGQFLVLAFCVVYLDFIYISNIRPDQLASQNFVKTDCLIMSKKLSTTGNYVRRYRADILINYRANGVQYNRWVSGNGLDASYAFSNTNQELILSDYKNGGNYSCWYDPKNPEVALLVMRHTWYVMLPLIIPAFVGMIAFLFLLKNGLVLLGVMRENRRKKINQANKFEF
jgi:hypothetical protein